MSSQSNNQQPPRPETRTRKFWRVVFGSMLGFLFSSIIVCILSSLIMVSIVISLSMSGKEKTTIKDDSVLKIELRHPIVEQGMDNPFAKFNFSNKYLQLGLDDILASLKAAAKDPKIKGIYLNASMPAAPPATLKEIHDALLQFKKSGKFIYAYNDFYTQNGYYLSSVADTILLNPAGRLDFRGYALQIMFYKGLLDKLDMNVQVVRHGQFKSAVEPFLMDKMSEANREQMTAMANTLWGTVIRDIAASRNIPEQELDHIANDLLCNVANDALNLKMVDQLGYADDMEKIIKKQIGLKDNQNINFVSIDTYRNTFSRFDNNRDKIAVLYAVGSIYDGKSNGDNGIYSETFIRELRKIVRDNQVKAIVLRVNSPGGSAMASENIWRELENAKKAGKVIVTSMGDYAASGGYYISCNSNCIVAQPNTMTGSIGVFGVILTMQDFLKSKLGITTDNVKTNAHADCGTGFRPWDDMELGKMQHSIEQIYGTFTQRVADGRNMSVERVDSIGQGRVWSGSDALALGLVDTLGSIDDAIAIAAKLSKTTDYSLVYYPKRTNLISMMVSDDDNVESALRTRLGNLYFTYQGLHQLTQQQGVQARMPMDLLIQ